MPATPDSSALLIFWAVPDFMLADRVPEQRTLSADDIGLNGMG
jgi:hypothetical protein